MSKGKPMHSTNSEKKVETRQRVGTNIQKTRNWSMRYETERSS